MIPLTLVEIAALAPGELRAAPGAERITGLVIDSRRVEPGDLFVAVGGGAAFGEDALARGAAATLVPDDAHAALAALAGAVRDRSRARVVAITGSTGKTSTKDILAALVAPHRRTVAAEASFNNELGVPLTLARLDDETEVCVLELAMRGFGQIAWLASFARPDLAVVTGIGPAHLELVGGALEGVARAKAELLDALPAGGVAVVPADAPELAPHLRGDLGVRRFSDDSVRSFQVNGDRSRIVVDVNGALVELETGITARHQAVNLAAALQAYDALGLPLDRAQEGAGSIVLSRLRLEERPLPGGGLLIDDCYNANPTSMLAALEHLAQRAGGRRRVAVLGEMLELGAAAAGYHREVGRRAAALGIEELVAVGPLARAYLETESGVWVETAAEAAAVVCALLEPGDCILVKGSRAVGLEAVGQTLAGLPDNANADTDR